MYIRYPRQNRAPRAVEITWAHRISVSAPAAPAADSDIGIGDRPGRPPAGPALRSADEFLMSRSDRRIDRPLLPASCPVCGHVVLRADGCPGRVPPAGVRCPATGAITPPGRNRCGPSAAASTGMSAARCAGGHRPVGRPPLRTADVRHRCRITVGRPTRAAQRPSAMAALARTRTPWCPAAGRVDRWADTPTSIVCARARAPITSPSWIVLPGVLPGLCTEWSLGLVE
jgi:hypothetical protein